MNVQPVVVTVPHDMEESLERWAGVVDRTILKVIVRDPFHGFADVFDAIGVGLEILNFGAQHVCGKHSPGLSKDPPEKNELQIFR